MGGCWRVGGFSPAGIANRRNPVSPSMQEEQVIVCEACGLAEGVDEHMRAKEKAKEKAKLLVNRFKKNFPTQYVK